MSRYTISKDQTVGYNKVDTQAPQSDGGGDKIDRVIDFVPDGVKGFTHAEIVDGRGAIIDGASRDRDVLIRSIKEVVDKLSIGSEGRPRSERAQFLQDVCRLFRLPTTIHEDTPANVEEVLQELEKPDSIKGTSGEPLLLRKTVPMGTNHQDAVAKASTESADDGRGSFSDEDAEGTE